MIDGIYNGKMNVPGMGEITGKIAFQTKGEELEAIVETMGMRNKFTGGKVKQNTFSFQGKWNTMMLALEYTIQGKVLDNQLEMLIHTNKGDFVIKGTKES